MIVPRKEARSFGKRSPAALFSGLLAAIGALAAAAAGCSSRDVDAPDVDAVDAGPILLGHWRATLELAGQELPFGLEIAQEEGRYVAYLVNGPERVRVPEVRVHDGRIEMRMPGFDNRLHADIDGRRLEGELVLVQRGGAERTLDFEARYGARWRFVAEPLTDNADVSGRWAATFVNESGEEYPAVGVFTQSHHELTGTFLTPLGDHRFLAGDVRDDEIALSTFDGARTFLYRAKVNSKGELEGTFWSASAGKQRFRARRDAAASLAEPADSTTLRAEADALQFTFPDLEGEPVSLSDPRFAGKVVVVTLCGSWHPGCHDETGFLAPWYLRNRERGLEIVALMFEHREALAEAAASVQRLRKKFDVQYTTLLAGPSDMDEAARRLPQLSGVHAFPTTLFIDRQGRVRHIHTGFSGPGAGEHYQRLIEEFDAVLEQLLAETDETSAARRPAGA